MNILVRKNAFGLQYMTEFENWRYFPDGITDKESMLKHFSKYDGPHQLSFVGGAGEPAVYYRVQRSEKQAVCNFDSNTRIVFEPLDIVPASEQIEFLKIHSSRELDMEADKLESDSERLTLYKKHAGEEALKGLQELIQEKMTDDAFKQQCQNHAQKYYNAVAVIELDK